jgi:hypothetical protein
MKDWLAGLCLACALVAVGCPGERCARDDDDSVPSDDDAADDDAADDDDSANPVEGPWGGRIGVAFGDDEFRGQQFMDHLDALNIRRVQINIWWGQFEPVDDEIHTTLLDAFLEQLPDDVVPLIRITARGTDWGMTDESGQTVPEELGIGGSYYDFVYRVVLHTQGRVPLLENDWEVDELCNWEGTAAQYAEMMRTFHQAVRDANPDALVVCGGAYADDDPEDQMFFAEVFDHLEADGGERPFDLFDLHLYAHPHRLPGQIAEMRATLDGNPLTLGTPLIATEFGGPTAPEVRDHDPDLYDQLIGEIRDDATLLATDLASTPLQPDGYPDRFRMFAYGVEPELDDKRDRIQARQQVQRAVIGIAGGITAQHWWNLTCEQVEESITLGVYFRSFTYGKLCLSHPDPDPGGMDFAPTPSYQTYSDMAAWLTDVVTASRLDVGDEELWVYELLRPSGDVFFVAWQQRDLFDGEDEPAVEVTFGVPWASVRAVDVFGDEPSPAVVDGEVTLSITDTPVYVESP